MTIRGYALEADRKEGLEDSAEVVRDFSNDPDSVPLMPSSSFDVLVYTLSHSNSKKPKTPSL